MDAADIFSHPLREETVQAIAKHDRTLRRLQSRRYPAWLKRRMFGRWVIRKFPHARAGFERNSF